MAFTSRDETDLLLPLYQGVHEESRFATFLDRLRRRTGAEFVGLSVRRADMPAADGSLFFSGLDLRARARELGIEDLYMLEGMHRSSLRPYRVYNVAEFSDHDPEYREKRARGIERLGIVDERVVRVSEETGIEAWLVLARARPCSAADSALLSNLAPYVATALRSMNMIERQRVEAALSADGLGRSGAGWILFDSDARVMSVERGTAIRLEEYLGSAPRIGERLRDIGIESERALTEAAARLTSDPDALPGTVVLCEEPRIDAVLVSGAKSSTSDMIVPMPVMIAYCRFPRNRCADRPRKLAALFDLPPREAELAIALSDGLSIADAAQAMGLTIETARNYSKKLYGKLDVSGQADLVRLVHSSSAMLV